MAKSIKLDIPKLAKAAGVSVDRLEEFELEVHMGCAIVQAHARRVGRPPMKLLHVLIMHCVEILRGHGFDRKASCNRVADALRIAKIDITDQRVVDIYKEYKYPHDKPREPTADEIRLGIMPMTDLELRAQYKAVGMTAEHLVDQLCLLIRRGQGALSFAAE